MSVPSKDQIEEYIASVEEYVASSFASVAPDIPAITDAIHQLWLDVTRFGPPEMPDLRFPTLGSFEVPAPPPPPPLPSPPISWYGEMSNFAARHKKLVGVVCIGAIGAGALAAYSASAIAKEKARARRAQKTVGVSASTRRLLVVVLGGDSPLGPPTIAGLEKEGYIVITSVSNPDAVAEIEAAGNGYVRALVFDPSKPSSLQPFLRSLKATLTLRFPLHTAGDPYQHSSVTFPILYSIISLLTLPSPSTTPIPTPLEHLDLTTTYESYLTRTHIMPLQAIQALLPLFRIDSIRSQDASYLFGGKKSVIICVPAADARVGVPYASAQSMSAAATVRGSEILRRELAQVQSQNMMHNVRVVVVDVGSVGKADSAHPHVLDEEAAAEIISQWTPSEQKVYAAPYAAFMSASARGSPRRPTSVNRFVRSIVSAVGRNATKGEHKSTFIVGLRLWAFGLKRSLRGDRIAVGAGAVTYTIASFLPSFILDALLNLPAALISVRNKYLPVSPHVVSPVPPPAPPEPEPETVAFEIDNTEEEPHAPVPLAPSLSASISEQSGVSDGASSGVGSDFTAPSTTGVESSWISVQD